MSKYDARLQRLEAKQQANGESYTLWIGEDETEEEALRRAGVPENAANVVFISWIGSDLPEDKRGSMRW